MNMWEMYDSLIEPIPDDVKIEDYFAGIQWTSVTVCGCTGATATNPLQTISRTEKNILDMRIYPETARLQNMITSSRNWLRLKTTIQWKGFWFS